ncbi:patatin-like phospholipase family protein [Peribacillus asahii]|uniref:Serine protease phospholipase, patatin family n=1 Tax=Peribacillus asahii TaxID=228899 RepID=A0A3Q9RM16_9BACI|nr:patatin family protein [Peribacillus asahii]AZV42640.1 serine protease phospholipase, patatin family [Peribacillus asahii]USK86906.1 patatin family protein [Peribacillus asahii]
MKKEKIGLVLEGGGMRGLYTIGVLDSFIDQQIMTDYVIGVSAGACNGVSYVSQQHGRNYRVNTNYIEDKRYVSLSNFMKTKSLFGMDFLFDEIPHQLEIFDYDAFLASSCEFVTGVTDVITGKPVYFGKEHMNYDSTVLRASSSIPVFSPMVDYKGGKYLDGGTSDPIPVRKAIADGCDKVIVVLTRDRNYVKTPEKFRIIYKRLFKKYPEMIRLLDQRHEIYNETLHYVTKLEREGRALVIAPSSPITISRFEKNKEKLKKLYQLGIQDAQATMNLIVEMVHGTAASYSK